MNSIFIVVIVLIFVVIIVFVVGKLFYKCMYDKKLWKIIYFKLLIINNFFLNFYEYLKFIYLLELLVN